MLLFRSDPFGGTHELLPCGLLGGNLVELFRKNNSKYYWYDFTVRGKRYRGSTKEINETRAQKAAALKLAAAIKGSDPLDRKPPTLREYPKDFLRWVCTGRLEADGRRYYRNGWRLLEQTKIAEMRMDQITKDQIEKLQFPGSASDGNNALRTLRRMYSKAKEGKRVFEVPEFALFKEHGRSLRLNDEAEWRLSAVAEQPLKDIIAVMRDTGMCNARELYCMRVENVDFDAGTIYTPDSKTESGRRFIPMSSRVKQIFVTRCAGRNEGWVWMSRYKGKHIGEGLACRQWARARQAAGLPRELVLYCARDDFGSFVLAKTGQVYCELPLEDAKDRGESSYVVRRTYYAWNEEKRRMTPADSVINRAHALEEAEAWYAEQRQTLAGVSACAKIPIMPVEKSPTQGGGQPA